jgi:hypothetical protein
VTAEFILSKDRKVRAIIFNRNNLDISNAGVGRRNRMGASISYRKEFRSFFGKPKNQKETPVQTPLSTAQPASTKTEDEQE